MKKHFYIIITLILFFTSSIYAQDTVKNVLKLNPVSICVGTANLQF